MGRFRQCMKKAGAHLGWEDHDLILNVPHCLRHGRIALAVDKNEAAGLRSSVSSIRRYGAPNEARKGNKDAKKEFKLQVKKIAKQRGSRK